jgi:hypothetical protein
MIDENIISEFGDKVNSEYFVKVSPQRWGMETVVGIYKTENGEHQNYYYALFYKNCELNDETDIVLFNGNWGLTQPPIRRSLKWLNDEFHTVFKLSDLIKEIEKS